MDGPVDTVREEQGMADVTFERKKPLTREEAAVWLTALARGFSHGGKVELPVGDDGVVTLRLPDEVTADFEVEVDGDEVEVELEFSWSLRASGGEEDETVEASDAD
jgi:amphi-Trp domain-containing protein